MQTATMPSTLSDIETGDVLVDPRTGKYLIFQLGNEEFGTSVLKVREIMKIQEITAIPQTPLFVKGSSIFGEELFL